MKSQAATKTQKLLRETIIKNPELILSDTEVMRALVAANDKLRGENIIDLRAAAMKSLETKLYDLENTHKSVIAAAYDNLTGMQQINRAVLKILEPKDLKGFIKVTSREMVEIMKIDYACLILETKQKNTEIKNPNSSSHLISAPTGFIQQYASCEKSSKDPKVILRSVGKPNELIYSNANCEIKSEACLFLSFEHKTELGVLVLGSKDKNQFSPKHGTDLLTFFASSYELILRRWLT